jgi:hypothetical protein
MGFIGLYMVSFKKKCGRCRKNYVLANNRTGFAVCFECHQKQMKGEIKDPQMKKMFDIPAQFYKDSMFLRDIKIKYLQYENLSERQVEAFKKSVLKLEEEAAAKQSQGSEPVVEVEIDTKAR